MKRFVFEYANYLKSIISESDYIYKETDLVTKIDLVCSMYKRGCLNTYEAMSALNGEHTRMLDIKDSYCDRFYV